MTIKEYKENEDIKREIEQERIQLLERAERLNEIQKQIDDRFKETEEIKAYNDEIDRYCREQGLTYYQYEKLCYWANKGIGDYPEPEKDNPEKCAERNIDVER